MLCQTPPLAERASIRTPPAPVNQAALPPYPPLMFTGLIQQVGLLERIEPAASGRRLVIDPAGWTHEPTPGESIAISGCCLTLAAPLVETGGRLTFDVVGETLSRTTLGRLREGSRVNLERSLRADDLLGGHVVQGHVDAVGEIVEIQPDPADWRMRIRPPAPLLDEIVHKGSIAVEGVSLTVAGVLADDFEIALIPTTLRETTLSDLQTGDAVNLETDVVAKTVVHFLRRRAGESA